ncbi:polyprenyl synthetase family protein [Methylonatrum kenyense]|uniref:polyprenyl synthetase family protein n=1 Tax=Methylonatrum kenyense TaxID=455253 RepID=UPI0020BF2CF7|nr:polyprenyl synthetase family protein [Methylonatrum kenyense]MCK8516309.1 polyprenyl synthetase family protein [Methylonatrum kenyense]
MSIETIRELLADDMAQVDALIQERLSSEVVLINQLGGYIVNSGGKRLRPMQVLLSAHACGYKGVAHRHLAAVVEFIHTATLLHDDVVDGSELRRGRETANQLWGNEASVLVGDFLYSRAFEMMVDVGDMRVMEIMARTTNTIAEGEVMQLLNVHDPDTTEQRYLQVIYSKTATLFEAACRLGAVLAGASAETENAVAAYGLELGTAFQLVDDALDYDGAVTDIGKNVGDDLAEGKPTMPLIRAMQEASETDRQLLRQAIESGGLERIDEVTNVIESTGAIAYTRALARQAAARATSHLASLSPGPYRDAMIELADFSVRRLQ